MCVKIIYVLKKGFQFFPPAFAQVMFLHDLNVELLVLHGKNSTNIDEIFEENKIDHIELKTDKQNKNKFQSYMNFIGYKKEIQKLIKKYNSSNVIWWFGNAESFMTVSKKLLKKIKFVSSILELYDMDSMYFKLLKDRIQYSLLNTCCEKHRAVIMKDWFKLKELPIVMENKPFEMDIKGNIDLYVSEEIKVILENKINFFVVYQGIIREDRPLDKIAMACDSLNQDNLYFLILGSYDPLYKEKMLKIYKNCIFVGFIPNPAHLLFTKYAHIGIANYDQSCLNNVFCAPNKIYEYAKFNIPFIASKNLALIEKTNEYNSGICIDFNDVDEIKNAIYKIENDYDSYKLGSKAMYSSVNNLEVVKGIMRQINEK